MLRDRRKRDAISSVPDGPDMETIVKLRAFLVASLCLLAAAPAGAAEGGDLYARISDAYMMGETGKLSAALTEAAGSMGSFSDSQKADILYVRQALAECRPAWWDKCKTARGRVSIVQPLLGKTVRAYYDPARKPGMGIKTRRGRTYVTAGWKPADMDSRDEGRYGYRKGEVTERSIWDTLAAGQVYSAVTMQVVAKMTGRQKLQLERAIAFRGNLVAIYHALPPARRYAIHTYMASFYYDKWGKDPMAAPRRAACGLVLCEVLANRASYPSLKLPPRLPAANAEAALGQHYKLTVKLNATWTISEDRLLREAIKRFAAANDTSVSQTGKVALPNGLPAAIDPKVDNTLRPKRDAWIKQQFDKASISQSVWNQGKRGAPPRR